MKKLLILLMLALANFNANAAIVCDGKVDTNLAFKLTVEKETHQAKIEVSDLNGKTILQKNYSNVEDYWDGHATGLITAKGLSIKYEDHFGCLRNVEVTAAIRYLRFFQTVTIPGCTGGTSFDDICFH